MFDAFCRILHSVLTFHTEHIYARQRELHANHTLRWGCVPNSVSMVTNILALIRTAYKYALTSRTTYKLNQLLLIVWIDGRSAREEACECACVCVCVADFFQICVFVECIFLSVFCSHRWLMGKLASHPLCDGYRFALREGAAQLVVWFIYIRFSLHKPLGQSSLSCVKIGFCVNINPFLYIVTCKNLRIWWKQTSAHHVSDNGDMCFGHAIYKS